MLEKVNNFDGSNPIWKFSLNTLYWTFLFLLDQTLGITKRVKDENGAQVRITESNTRIGKKILNAHDKNIKDFSKFNGHLNFDAAIELPNISSENFDKNFFDFWRKNIGLPIVIRGFLKNAKILELMSHENLVSNFGDNEISCVEIINKNRKQSKVGQNLTVTDTTLEEFLTSKKFENHYINNFYGIVDDDDFLVSCKGDDINHVMGKPNAFTQWFISRPKDVTGTVLHCAPADNMFLNITGNKEWHFIDPSYTPIMLPTVSKFGIACVSELEEDFEGEFYTDLIKNYSELRHLPIYKTVLNEGDMLYNPPWWWHRVKNLSSLTIGCATRYLDEVKSMTNSKTLYTGILIESLKNPKKSAFYVTFKTLKDKKNASKITNILFSRDKKEK